MQHYRPVSLCLSVTSQCSVEMAERNGLSSFLEQRLSLVTPDYGLGNIGKFLGLTTSKRPRKDGCKILWTYITTSIRNNTL